MPSWFSQAAASLTIPTTAKKREHPAATPKSRLPNESRPRATRPTRPTQAAQQRMLPQPVPTYQAQASPRIGTGARAGKASAFGTAQRQPLSPIQSGAVVYPGSDVGQNPHRTVRFQLPLPSPTPTQPEPFVYPQVPQRGPEYVTITRSPIADLERGRYRDRVYIPPSPSPPPPTFAVPRGSVTPPSAATFYPYPYNIARTAEYNYVRDVFTDNTSEIVNVDFAVNNGTAPANYGQRRIGPFKLLRTLGSGHFGKSYVAHDAGSGRVVCARIVKKEKLTKDVKLRNGLLVEARCFKIIAASTARDRAFLIEAYGILQDEERILFVMPLMQCDLIDGLPASGAKLDRGLVRRWVAQLALGIDALHRMGIIHRDIKPENVLLDAPGGNVRIADFNAAFIVQGGQPIADGEVYTDRLIGSMPYIAWEVARKTWYGKMVDWWALGCLMFSLLTNTVLFERHGTRETYARWNKNQEGMSFLSYMGKLTEEEESVIAGLIDLYPCSRYQLRHLRHHTYFIDENRVNVFDTLLREPLADLQSVGRPVHPSLLQVEDALAEEPLCFAGPRPLKSLPAAGSGPVTSVAVFPDPNDFSGFGWVNERGIWEGHREA